jgi:hypothetical protein
VSIKGRGYRWFKDALARRDLALVKATAAELPAKPHNAEAPAVR